MRDFANPEGFYVYVLIDPRDGMVFYVGKGKGKRHANHLSEYRNARISNSAKYAKIGEITAAGYEPKALCVRDGMSSRDALTIETQIIKKLGRKYLTNQLDPARSEAMVAYRYARAFLSHSFTWDRWEEFKKWPYPKQCQWIQLKGELEGAIAWCKSLMSPEELKSIQGEP